MRSIHRTLLGGASALALCSLMSSSVLADPIETVVVTGVRGSLKDSLLAKKLSPLITDNVSTKDIGQLPDVTIAEELNRLPGVNTTRDRGNASQAAVRGLGPRLVFGLVNGREVASSEPSQDIRWEAYPSEVLSGAQVYKSQSAELIPGGIAATIDIRTIQPLDYEGPSLNLRAGPTYNQEGEQLPHYDPWGLRASAGYITHINDNFAIAIAGSYQKEKNGFPDFRTWGWNTPDTGQPGDLNGDGRPDFTTWGLNTEVKEVQQDRVALMGAAGWRPNENLEVKFDALYSSYSIHEDQFQTWYGNNILGNWANGNSGTYNCPTCSYTIRNNVVVAANLPGSFGNYQSEIARYSEHHSLFVTGLNLDWTEGAWDAKLDLSHSEAWRHGRWAAVYLDTEYPTDLAYDLTPGHAPWAKVSGNPADPALQSIGGYTGAFNGRAGDVNPQNASDRLSAVSFDVSHAFDGSFITALDAGLRFSERAKYHQAWDWGPTAPPMSLANAGLEDFSLESFTAPPLVWGDWDTLFPLVYGPNALKPPPGSEQLLAHSKVSEDTFDGYLKADFSHDFGDVPMSGSIGVRVAHVGTTSTGYNNLGGAITPAKLSNDYTDVLPSMNLVFHLTDDSQLHFGAAIAISRPPLDALVTGLTLSTTPPFTGFGGNPFLKPYKADQLDLSYEWYWHDESLFAVAPYYKHLQTYVTALVVPETINGNNYLISSQGNGRGGDVEGIELTLQTRFYFLPGFWSDFGTYMNYAYATSNIKEVTPAKNAFGQTPYRMVGLTPHTLEADLFYDRDGFEARVAYKYHSAAASAPTWVGTTLKGTDSEGLLDASMSYQWNDHIGLRLQGRNLTNEPNRYSVDNNVYELSNDGGYQVYGRSFLFDISYKN